MKLTDPKLLAALPREVPYKLFDCEGRLVQIQKLQIQLLSELGKH